MLKLSLSLTATLCKPEHVESNRSGTSHTRQYGYGSKPIKYLLSRDYHLFKRLFKGHRGTGFDPQPYIISRSIGGP